MFNPFRPLLRWFQEQETLPTGSSHVVLWLVRGVFGAILIGLGIVAFRYFSEPPRNDLSSATLAFTVVLGGGFLVVMTAATVAIALLFNADGARHPAALAGATVAVIVFVGGPALMAALRRTAERA